MVIVGVIVVVIIVVVVVVVVVVVIVIMHKDTHAGRYVMFNTQYNLKSGI